MSDSLNVTYGDGLLEPLNVPRFAVGGFTLQANGTEMLLVLQSALPLLNRNTNAMSDQLGQQAMAVVSISPGTAKDLCILLGEVVDNHERLYGPITTPLMKKIEGPERGPRAIELAGVR